MVAWASVFLSHICFCSHYRLDVVWVEYAIFKLSTAST